MMNYVEILATHTPTPPHGCAEENQKQAPGKMFDKLEKFIEFGDSYSFFHEQKWVCSTEA
jgi:hypothetical protein